MTMEKWDLRYLRIAMFEVAEWSKDPDKKVGCVIVSPDRRQVTMGFNGLPIGVADTEARLNNKELKIKLTAHAEVNAVLNARRDLTNWTLYVTAPPCTNCAKVVIQAGIARVVCPRLSVDSSWYLDQCIARTIMEEASIVCTEYDMEEL